MQPKTLTLYSPVKGKLIDLSQVPDEAFAQKMLGDGVAIEPQENFIYAPVDAKVKTLHKCLHAIVLETKDFEILIHIGIDSVSLKGQRFKTFVKEGDTVTRGQKLIEFDKDFLAQYTTSNVVVMVIAAPLEVTLKKEQPQEVNLQTKVFEVSYNQETQTNNTSKNDYTVFTEEFVVSYKAGLHARPAGEVAALAQSFSNTDIFILKDGKQANAKSVVEILGLSVDCGDKIQIKSCGINADKAAMEVKRFIQGDLKNNVIGDTIIDTPAEPNNAGEIKIKGVGIFDGLSIGKTYVVKDLQFNLEEKSPLSPEEELSKFLTSLHNVKSALDKERHAVYGQKDRE